MERGPLRILTPDEGNIIRIGPDLWGKFRDIRLAALSDSPNAFGSTLAREQALTEEDWRLRLANGAMFMALSGETPVGMAGGVPTDDAGDAYLVSMWVHPDFRRLHLADRLVVAVLDWARSEGYHGIRLHVAVDNEAAERLYQGRGFARTGATQPVRPEEP
ncbi:MAG: GNAT family N-acetyltransferase [Candidatus Dormiibacterota bacterium]